MPVPTPDGGLAPASDSTSASPKSLGNSKPSSTPKSSPLSKTATVSKGTQPPKVTSPKASPSKAPGAPLSAAPTSFPTEGTKKVRRKASQPIINWFQRKLAGRKPHPSHSVVPGYERGRDPSPRHQRPISQSRSVGPSSRKRRSGATTGDPDAELDLSVRDGTSMRSRSLSPSLGPDSMWSPSMQFEADDDASIRPLPPTSPPSPSPSTTTHLTQTSHSGYFSDRRTVASHSASTKPTTLLSVDIGLGAQLAHIAQAHTPIPNVVAPSPTSPQFGRFPSTRSAHHQPTSSAASVTFSSVAYPSSPLSTGPYPLVEDGAADEDVTTQVPTHSLPHPRNNPRPSSPPLDNASTLTLASSNFNMQRPIEPDAISASVRAIRRRGSWESGDSRWSAVVGMRRPGSRTAGSWRTGGSIGGGIILDSDHVEQQDDSGSDDESEDKLTTGPDDVSETKPEEVPIPESPIKPHVSPVTPLSILTGLPKAIEESGERTLDDGPATAVPGRTSIDAGDETEKESADGHTQRSDERKKVDVVSAALGSLPE